MHFIIIVFDDIFMHVLARRAVQSQQLRGVQCAASNCLACNVQPAIVWRAAASNCLACSSKQLSGVQQLAIAWRALPAIVFLRRLLVRL